MAWWIFVLLLFYASARWEAVGTAIRIIFGVIGAVGMLILLKIGFIPVFLTALIEIPINLLKGVFGILQAIFT